MFKEEYKINDNGEIIFSQSSKKIPKQPKKRHGKSTFAKKKNESGRRILQGKVFE